MSEHSDGCLPQPPMPLIVASAGPIGQSRGLMNVKRRRHLRSWIRPVKARPGYCLFPCDARRMAGEYALKDTLAASSIGGGNADAVPPA